MAAKKGGSKKKGGTLSVDFSGVEAGGKAVPDGNYTLEVKEVTEEESSEGNPYLKFIYKIVGGPAANAVVYDNASLQPQALWRLKTILECFEMEVPDGAMDIDIEELVGQQLDAEIVGEEYQGRKRPRVAGFHGPAGTLDKDDDRDAAEDVKSDDDDKKTSTAKKKTAGRTKSRVGETVKFKDDRNKTLTGTITAEDGDKVTVDVKGDEWELEAADLID